MTKTKSYAKPIYGLVALALVLGLTMVPATPAVADVDDASLAALGNGTADWSTEQAHSGSRSAKFYVPGSSDFATVYIPIDITLGDIYQLSFWEWVSSFECGHPAKVIIAIDLDDDGDLDFGIDEVMAGSGNVGNDGYVVYSSIVEMWPWVNWAYWDEINAFDLQSQSSTFDPGGWLLGGDTPYSANKVKMIAIAMGGSWKWKGITAYIDDLTINGIPYEFEPPPPPPPPTEVWVDDDWADSSPSDVVDGHTFGYDAFATIQYGIDAVAASTVNVAAGTYAEHLIIDKSNLNLMGEDKNTTIIDATQDSSWPVAKAGILIGEYPLVDGVHGVTISGFTIRDAAIDETGGNFGGDKYGPGPGGLAGIQIYNSSNNTIENNLLINNYWQIWLVAEWPAAGYTECKNNRIANNVIQNSENDGVYLYSDGGVFVQGTEIVGNKISNAYGSAASGIEFWGYPEGGATPTITGTVVRGNNITGCTYGVRIRADVGDITGTTVNLNNIVGNTNYGVYNDVASTIDAENNWWGDASGPYDPAGDNEVPPCTGDPTTEINANGTGDKVSDNVDYCPWLISSWPYVEFAQFTIDHAKIDFKKKVDDDKVRVEGKLELDLDCGNDVDISDDVIVTVGPLSETIKKMEEKGKKGETWEYKRPKDDGGIIKHMTINWKNGKFDFSMDKADLTALALAGPEVTISVQIGDDLGSASILMMEKKNKWDYKAPRH